MKFGCGSSFTSSGTVLQHRLKRRSATVQFDDAAMGKPNVAEPAHLVKYGMPKKKNPSPHGQLVAAAKLLTAQAIEDDADRRSLERNKAGKFLAKMTPDDWDWVIERVRDGSTDSNIIRHPRIADYGLGSGTIAVKRRQDPEFGQRYLEALEDAFLTVAQETRAVARGEPGFSSGDVQRDRLIVETDLKLASKLSRKLLGDKALIEASSFNITIRQDSDDVC